MKKIITLICISLVATCLTSHGQLDPIYATYINNPLTINPAYTGSNNMLNAMLQYRKQWAGLESSPATFNFNSHMSLIRNKLGLGIQVVQDKIGETKNTSFDFLYSYKIDLDGAILSFGMQSGFTRYTTDPSMLTIRDPGDNAFASYTEMKFNTGVGVMLKSDKYILGLSVPRLIPATVNMGAGDVELYSRTYYLFGSYVFFISEDIRFKPAVLMRAAANIPVSYDLNASMTFKERYTGGIFTRNFSTGGVLVQAIAGNFRFGYTFEMPFSPSSSLNYVSHELMVGMGISVLGYHDRTPKTY